MFGIQTHCLPGASTQARITANIRNLLNVLSLFLSLAQHIATLQSC